MHIKRQIKPPIQKTESHYVWLWKIIDGAVADAFNNHPEYIAKGIKHTVVRNSINKRVTGAVRAASLTRGLSEKTG